VVCVTVEEVPSLGQESQDVHFYVLANGGKQDILKVSKLKLRGPPDDFLKNHLDRPIGAYTQMRQNFWAFQPESWITYHVCTIMEVEVPNSNNLFILVERVDDRLEIMMGEGLVARSFMLEIRATGRARRSDRCFQLPRQIVRGRLTVRQLLDWLSSSVCKRWQPYHILESNCQHLAEDLERFLGSAGIPSEGELRFDNQWQQQQHHTLHLQQLALQRQAGLAQAGPVGLGSAVPWSTGGLPGPAPSGPPSAPAQWASMPGQARWEGHIVQALPDYVLMNDGTLEPRLTGKCMPTKGTDNDCSIQ